MPLRRITLSLGFIACVLGANWAALNVGSLGPHGVRTLPVLPGCEASSAILFVGASFTLRDAMHRLASWHWVLGAILVGAATSFLVAPRLALASGATFLVSESADFLVYSRLRRRSPALAVLLSNAVGALVDSAMFLILAFGLAAMTDLLACQAIGKLEWSIVLTPLMLVRRRDARR